MFYTLGKFIFVHKGGISSWRVRTTMIAGSLVDLYYAFMFKNLIDLLIDNKI